MRFFLEYFLNQLFKNILRLYIFDKYTSINNHDSWPLSWLCLYFEKKIGTIQGIYAQYISEKFVWFLIPINNDKLIK